MTQRNRFLLSEFIVPIAFMVMMIAFSSHFLNHNPESLARTLRMEYYTNSVALIKPSGDNRKAWVASFKKVSGRMETEYLEEEMDMSAELKRRKGHTLTNERRQAIIGVEKADGNLIGYYSSNSYHSCPIVINLMSNAVLAMLSINSEKKYAVRVANHPMQQYEGFPSGSTQGNTIIMYAYILSIILALISASEMRLPLWERLNGMKTLEKMAGVRPIIYWLTNYCGDFAVNLIMTIILMGILCVINMIGNGQQFEGRYEKLIIALIIFGYLCWSSIPYSYFLSSILKTSHDGFTHFIVLHFSLGILPMSITYQVMRVDISDFAIVLRYILHIFPPYSLTSALVHYFHIVMDRSFCNVMDHDRCAEYENALNSEDDSKLAEKLHVKLFSDSILRACCKSFCESEGICHKKKQFFVNTPVPGLLVDIFAIGAQGVFFWLTVLLMENKIPQNIFFYLKTTLLGDKEIKATLEDTRDTEEPEDVKREHQRVDYMIDIEDNVESEIILVQDVCKFYVTEKCIDHVYFSIPVRSTTGLLGLAKSGMSTLIRLLTGELRLSAGNIYMENEHLTKRNRRHCTMKMGYCPQDNAYYPDLTGFQMLKLFAQLRGVPESQIDVQVRRWLTTLDLEGVARMSCKGYRPGQRQLLCCAMAMIGWTRVVLMDQPTAELDLREREIFWMAINEAKKKGQTTFFTSTFTEEVRYCTDKAMILDNGEILSVDEPSEVFQENSRGFTLSIKLRALAFKSLTPYEVGTKVDQLRDHIIRHLSPCELTVDEGNTLIYQMKDLTTKLSYAYGIMEGARERFPNLLDNFLISESSLDDVIYNLHKKARMRKSVTEDGNEEEHRHSGSI
ncbi:ATP-binding cassette sub-family A member 3 [Folsomia candida]|uniref:ATP-binding cassette sub-family A member 3 n=1 Tax=Folsomia candida TaxID=158441 RepID=UPI00160537A8|nr:ATP-binding cassette sub-family A member 3 [Folsomia candida]